MPGFLSIDYFDLIVLYLPLGLIGLWRWSIWFIKRITGLWYRQTPVRLGYCPTLSVVTPVYNEDPILFRRALNSWKSNEVDEIIAVIDKSDTLCVEVFKDFAEKFSGAKLIVTPKQGKRLALADGIKVASGEIIALADSDTVWDPNIRATMVAPFVDERVGGVTTRQDVLAPKTLAQRLFNIHLDQRYLDEMTYLAVAGNALTCLSGRTAVYRREALLSVLPGMENEKFMGVPCISGEDKCLTRLVQANGWHMRYQRNIRVFTTGAVSMRTFLKQQIRWIRNSWRSDLKSLGSWCLWRNEKVLALHMVDRIIVPFTLLIGPIYLVLSIYRHNWIAVAVLVVWWHLSRGLKLYSHLRQHPRNILIIPSYIVMSYVLAVLKIYAFFTIRRQGWITRWDTTRLLQLAWFKKIPSYAATAAVIVVLGSLVVHLNDFVRANPTVIQARRIVLSPTPADRLVYSMVDIEVHRQAILQSLKDKYFGTLEIARKDTLFQLSHLLNVRLSAVIQANQSTIINPSVIDVGQRVIIPVGELRTPLSTELMQGAPVPLVTYVPVENTIYVSGADSAIDIPTLAAQMSQSGLIEEIAPHEWIVRASIFVQDGATLLITGDTVQWLKLRSENTEFSWIRAYNSAILIDHTKITSWNEQTNDFDRTYDEDGRSYLLAKYNGRMDVLDSEIAYLGYGITKGYGVENHHAGGIYGLAWKTLNDSFGKYLITGVVRNNRIHHNYYGVYTYGATGMLMEDNEVYNNIEYGFDPHDDSNNLLIVNNVAHNNGNHGIITSKRCFNNIIRGNITYGNRLHGIMLDRQSNNNLVENNETYDNVDGIKLFDSHDNLIRNNNIRDNKNGIRANSASSNNLFENNTIMDQSQRGIYLYEGAYNNVALNNVIKGNQVAVYFKDAVDNLVIGSLQAKENKQSVKTQGNSSGNQVEISQ